MFTSLRYFYLGEEVLAAIPTAAVKLVTGFVLIELAEEGKEGLCIGLMGTAALALETVFKSL